MSGPPYGDRPATRVGRWLLFEGGRCVRLSRLQQCLFALGLKTSHPTPTTGGTQQ